MSPSSPIRELILSDAKIDNFAGSGQPWIVPETDLRRQAVSPLRGYIYQLHQSAAAWISLGESDILHLEVAEDFSQILYDPNKLDEILQATQVKDTRESGAVSLNSMDVIGAVESLYRLKKENAGREVHVNFLTTSNIGRERKNPLHSGVAGLHAWRLAAEGGDVAEIRAALLSRVETKELKAFIAQSSDENLRLELIKPLTFVCGAQSWESIEAANRQALVALREEVRSTAEMAHRAYDVVLSHLTKAILSSSDRRLSRHQLITCLELATAIGVPSQTFMHLIGEAAIHKAAAPIAKEDLVALARALLDAGLPPSIRILFPDALPRARLAFDAVKAFSRTVIERDVPVNSLPLKRTIAELPALSERRHLVIGPPGSGKSNTLWRYADELLSAGTTIPIFLSVAQLSLWDDVTALITDVSPKLSLESIFNDQRVCIFLDGWSEFATGESAAEKRKALRALRGTRVIAAGKFVDPEDTMFKIWSLELLPLDLVSQAVKAAHPGGPTLTSSVLDLLRLPLLLSIHLFSGAKASEIGEILRQFHEHIARDIPDSFTQALSSSVATMTLSDDRSFGRLFFELEAEAHKRNFTECRNTLQRLGTIEKRGSQAVPVHELYWSWLAGRGLLTGELTPQVIGVLHTRESYALALQSGARPTEAHIQAASNDDLVLAAALDASLPSTAPNLILSAALDRAFIDERLSVRHRAGLAALELIKPDYLRRALDVLSELAAAKLQVPAWSQALRPDVLFRHRAIVADWIGSDGSHLVLDAIAERGGEEWVPWLEQMALTRKITYVDALASALACSSNIPSWGDSCLDELLGSAPWKLRNVAIRRSNLALSRQIAVNYVRLVETVISRSSSAWIDLNRILVGCGDDEVFRLLLAGFSSMPRRSQELLGFAVVDLGPSWIASFQKIAFAEREASHHHKLANVLSTEIDDATARAWIASGHDEVGWRVLIARHGEEILPELIAHLPQSFAHHHHIPALASIRFFQSAPTSLVQELWGRIGTPMQPKAMQDLLNALATVDLGGVASIVRFILDQPDALPIYHIAQAMKLYDEWRRKFGIEVQIKTSAGKNLTFHQWVALYTVQRWEDHFTPTVLAWAPDVAVEIILEHFQHDDEKSAAALNALRLNYYHEKLLERMLSTEKLANLVPKVFSDCLDTFPVNSLHRCIDSSHIDQGELLSKLASTANPLHRSAHAKLLRKVLEEPMKLHAIRCVANMLRGYTRHDVFQLLNEIICHREDRWFWLIREIETARGERLIDELGCFLH